MSADNWAICPACYKREIANLEEQKKKFVTAYGKISEEKYLELQKIIEKGIDKESFRTLREDYNIHTEEYGTFSVEYRCSCSICNFNYNYEHTEDIVD